MRRLLFGLALSVTLSSAVQAAGNLADRMALLEKIFEGSASAQEFRRLYTNSVIVPWYSYDGSTEYFAKYDQLILEVGLYQRYVLSMYVPFERGATNVLPPTLRVTEVPQVDIKTYGQATIHFGYSSEFDAKAWRHLYQRGGDLSAIGFSAVTNQPVAGFDRALYKQ